jgi:hypothetical protein
LRAAGTHDRDAEHHAEAAALFDGVGLHSLARSERARARLAREAATVEREQAELRRARVD